MIYALESDEMYESDPDFYESDFESRSRRGRSRSGRVSTPPRSGGRPGGGPQYVTKGEHEAALKSVTAQINKIVSQLDSVNARQEKKIAELEKKQKGMAESSLVMSLLAKPTLAAKAGVPQADVDRVVNAVEIKGPDPLLMALGSGALGGGFGGGGSDNSLGGPLMFLLLADRLKP